MGLSMQSLELNDCTKVIRFLAEYESEDAPTVQMAGRLIEAVRSLMSAAVNVTRCAFSRVFIYGVCCVGLNLHFQVTYANELCMGSVSAQCGRTESLWVGIGAAFVSKVLILLKVCSITRYLVNVWSLAWHYLQF